MFYFRLTTVDMSYLRFLRKRDKTIPASTNDGPVFYNSASGWWQTSTVKEKHTIHSQNGSYSTEKSPVPSRKRNQTVPFPSFFHVRRQGWPFQQKRRIPHKMVHQLREVEKASPKGKGSSKVIEFVLRNHL